MTDEKISRQLRDQLIEQSRCMRAEPTPAEALLWKKIRKRQLGSFKFRCQHIIHTYIVDFYCPEVRLVVEIDGPVHNGQSEYDRGRDEILLELNYQVLRFKNESVLSDIDFVISSIYDACIRRNAVPGE
jgi:very-short-patch-repair endonuclease